MSVYRYERAHNQARRAYAGLVELEIDEPYEHPAYAKWLRWAELAEDIYFRLSPEDRKFARSLVN